MSYVKLMADYCSSGVWGIGGDNIDIDSVPIPFWLKTMITEWVAHYDRHGMDSDFDDGTFTKMGFAIAHKMKQNLPDEWTVVYYREDTGAREVIK